MASLCASKGMARCTRSISRQQREVTTPKVRMQQLLKQQVSILGAEPAKVSASQQFCRARSCGSWAGDWQTIYIPFREFVPVVRARYDPTAPPLNPSTVRQIGFRLSRFDFNNLANPKYKPGPFSLEVGAGKNGARISRMRHPTAA